MIDGFTIASDEQSVVEERRGERADQWSDPVHRLSLENTARDRGAQRARGIQGSARERTDREDARRQREADREPANARRFGIHRGSENHEGEEEGRYGLEPDGLTCAGLQRDRLTADPCRFGEQ